MTFCTVEALFVSLIVTLISNVLFPALTFVLFAGEFTTQSFGGLWSTVILNMVKFPERLKVFSVGETFDIFPSDCYIEIPSEMFHC